jgi:hypothetical protein
MGERMCTWRTPRIGPDRILAASPPATNSMLTTRKIEGKENETGRKSGGVRSRPAFLEDKKQ